MKQSLHAFRKIVLVLAIFLYALGLHAQPYSWKNVAIGGGGFVTGIITSKTQPGPMYARTDVGGAYRWDAVNATWIPLMDWASENQQGMFGTESIAIDPQSPNIVYMSAGISYFNSGRSYLLRSTDYGANFTVTEVTGQFKIHGNGMGRQNGERLQVDPVNSNILYCGTRWNGLWKSTNAGSTWSRLDALNVTTTPNENGVCFVVPDKSSIANGATQRFFAGISRTGSGQNFYRSDDAGVSFTAVVNPNLGAGQMPQRAVLAGDGNLIITYANGAGPYGTGSEPFDQGQIWKYNITSGSWTNITPSGGRPMGGISVDPNNPQRMVASTSNTYWLQYNNVYGDRFYITTNGGASWTDIVETKGFALDPNGVSWVNGHSIHWAGSIEFDPSNTNKVLVTSGNGIFVNEDINASNVWKFTVKGLEETVPLNFLSIPGGPVFSAIGDYDGFKHTDLTQYGAIHKPETGSTSGLDYARLNTNKLVRVGSSMYYSNDMAATWTKTATLNGSGGQVALSADGNVLLHSPDNSSTSYRSVNNGTTWTPVAGLTINSAMPVGDPVNSSKFYAYSSNNNSPTPNGTLLLSTDGGITFTQAGSPGSWGSRIIRTVPGREGHLWVPLYNGGLTRSVNSGASFTPVSTVTYCGAVGIGKSLQPGSYETVFIWGTVDGVLGLFRSVNEGASWVRVNDDEHEYGGPANGQFVVGDMNVFGRVYMSTAGRGVVYGEDLSSLPVTLKRFDVQLQNNIANLSWTTATELNNSYFDIERSTYGATFYKVGLVTSKAVNGSSNLPLIYNYTDDIRDLNGMIYYRLKQVDKDGKVIYSQVLSINVSRESITKLQVYPNPSGNGNVNLRVQLGSSKRVKVRFSNMLGVVVYSGLPLSLSAGTSAIKINDAPHLAKGSYAVELIDVRSGNTISQSKFLVH
jgi:xyloglucan-specific exo-beta-1,4-glucanase